MPSSARGLSLQRVPLAKHGCEPRPIKDPCEQRCRGGLPSGTLRSRCGPASARVPRPCTAGPRLQNAVVEDRDAHDPEAWTTVRAEGEVGYQRRPCPGCPWRRDTPVGRFPADVFDRSRHTSMPKAFGPNWDGRFGTTFGCHESGPERPRDCAGYLAVEGRSSIAVRVAVVTGNLPASALEPQPGWPNLYPSYEAMAQANGCSPTDTGAGRAGT